MSRACFVRRAFSKAEAYCLSAIELAERRQFDNLSVSRYLQHLADCRNALGDFAGAEATQIDAIEKLKDAYGATHAATAAGLSKLAAIYVTYDT